MLFSVSGDMILTKEQADIFKGPGPHYNRGIAPRWAGLWPAADGSKPGTVGIHYAIDQGFTDSQIRHFLNSMKEIQDNTCIR